MKKEVKNKRKERRFHPGTRLGLVEGEEGETGWKRVCQEQESRSPHCPWSGYYLTKWKQHGGRWDTAQVQLTKSLSASLPRDLSPVLYKAPQHWRGVPRTIPYLPLIIYSLLLCQVPHLAQAPKSRGCSAHCYLLILIAQRLSSWCLE